MARRAMGLGLPKRRRALAAIDIARLPGFTTRRWRVGNAQAAGRGEAHLAYWEKGLGIGADGEEQPLWRAQQALASRRPASVAAELGACYTFSEEA